MGFAQTTLTSGAGITARITFYQLEQASNVNPNPGWPHAVTAPRMTAMISAFGEGVGFAFETYGDGATGIGIRLRETTTSLAMPPVTDTDTIACGGFVWPATPPEPGPTNTAVWSGPDEVTDDLAFAKSTGVYKMRDTEPMPTYGDGPTNPCHPQHFGMKYTLGGETTSSVSTSIVSNTTGPTTVTPSWAADGGGTRDLGSVTVALGLSGGCWRTLSGTVIVVDDVEYNGEAVSFEGFDETSHGMRCLGNGGTLTLSIVDWVSTSAYMFSAGVMAPIIIDYDVDGYAWTQDGYGEFLIPDNAGGGTVVAAPYVERVVYWANSWDASLVRPWIVGADVDSTWAAANPSPPFPNVETVDPVDTACEVEEAGLSCDPSVTLPFEVGFDDPVNIAWPDDVDDAPPSEWEPDGASTACPGVGSCVLGLCAAAGDYHVLADDGSLEVYRADGSQVWRIIVHDGAAAAGIKRMLVEDFFSRYTSKSDPYSSGTDWTTEETLPFAYQHMKALPTVRVTDTGHNKNVLVALNYPNVGGILWAGSDVWNWGNRCGLKWTWTSDASFTLTFGVSYSTCVVNDTETIPDRWEDFSVTRTTGNTESWAIALAQAATSEEGIVDLAGHSEPDLRHVDELSLTGFANDTGSDVNLYIERLDLVGSPLNIANKDTATTFYVRPDPETGLPLSYVGLETTTAGVRATRQYVGAITPDPSDQAGFVFVNCLRSSAGTQDGLRSLVELRDRIGLYSEGLTCECACENGDTSYDGLFVDADDNDMLGGTLYASDVVEQIDLLPASLAARPRVGVIYPCSGVPLPCMVRKRLRQSAHGVVRNPSGIRQGKDVTVALWQSETTNPGPGEAIVVGTDMTDDYGRYDFDALPGVLENLYLGVSTSTTTEPTSWHQTRNKLRHWLGVILYGTSGLHPCLEHNTSLAQVFLAYENGEGIDWRLWTRSRDWVDAQSVTEADGGTLPQWDRNHRCASNALLFRNSAGYLARTVQTGRRNLWATPQTNIECDYFAAFGGHNEVGIVFPSATAWQFQRYSARTLDPVGDTEVVLASSVLDNLPALSHETATNSWTALVPTASNNVAMMRRSLHGDGPEWSLLGTFAYQHASLDVSERETWIAGVTTGGALKCSRTHARTGELIDEYDVADEVYAGRPAISYLKPINRLVIAAGNVAGSTIVVYTSDNRGRTWSDPVELEL